MLHYRDASPPRLRHGKIDEEEDEEATAAREDVEAKRQEIVALWEG